MINRSGLPAEPFRTDRFPYGNVELQKEPISRRVTTSAYDIVINGDGRITSLIVGDAQFMSNQPGMAGGSSIPGFWGSRSLTRPARLSRAVTRIRQPRKLLRRPSARQDVSVRQRFENNATLA